MVHEYDDVLCLLLGRNILLLISFGLVNRIKFTFVIETMVSCTCFLQAAIRETLVLPNCESISIPWMTGEKDDWVPQKVAPFIWVRQESGESTGRAASNSQPGEVKTKANTNKGSKQDEDHEKGKNSLFTQHSSIQQAVEPVSFSESSSTQSVSNDQSLNGNAIEDLKVPLLHSDETQDSCVTSRAESTELTVGRMVSVAEEQILADEDSKPKKIGRRARMMDLGKKMGEKLEEKRRHIEEKGRNIVEKMRGHDT